MTRRLRVLLVLVVAIFLIGSVGGAFVYSTLRRPLPQLNGRITLKGLDGNVEIDRDAAGIPQIYAQTPHDLFLAQGYVAAQDRWWQMEFNRHIGLERVMNYQA
jgi:penicillin amidase